MRKVTRPVEPEILHSYGPTWSDRYVSKRKKDPQAKFFWPNPDYYHIIRDCLLSMTQRHCAFCDGPLGAESRETVEHFRPKSQFPELAFAWDNLFPCCDVCQANKGEKFDEKLLKPDDAAYSFNRYFIVNYKTGAIDVSPLAGAADAARAQLTIDMYGLNKVVRKSARLRELRVFQQCPEINLEDCNYRYFLEADGAAG